MSRDQDPQVRSRTMFIGTVVAAIALLLLGVPWPIALLAGIGGFFVSRFTGRKIVAAIDPFAVGEPWRQFVQGAQRAGQRLHDTVGAADDGPLKDRMLTIVDRLDDGLVEVWTIARRGHQIDETVRRLDPTALRSKEATLEARMDETPSADLESALTSVRSQLESIERLKVESTKTADRLRLTQTRLEELTTRAAEVAIGAGDTDAYEHDVDDLVIELEALRQAVEEINRP